MIQSVKVTSDLLKFCQISNREMRHGGKHFIVTIISDQFLGHSRVTRHRMVYDVLGDLMPQRIHALALQTMTADEAASLLTQGK